MRGATPIMVVLTAPQARQIERYMTQFRIERPRWTVQGRNHICEIRAHHHDHGPLLRCRIDLFDPAQSGEDGGNIHLNISDVGGEEEIAHRRRRIEELSYALYPRIGEHVRWGWPQGQARISLIRAKHGQGMGRRFSGGWPEADEQLFRQGVWALAQFVMRLNSWVNPKVPKDESAEQEGAADGEPEAAGTPA